MAKKTHKLSDREYQYEVVLFHDTDYYDECNQYILLNMNCIYIVHDKDIYEEDFYDDEGNLLYESGTPKNKHTHYIIKFKNGKSITAVSKLIGCNVNDVEYIDSMTKALKYLIHYKYDNKYNYSELEVKFTDEKLYKRFRELIFDDLEEDDKVQPLIEYIVNFNGAIEFVTFLRYVYTTRQWSTYRRNVSTFIKLIDEHNSHFLRYGKIF